MIVYGPPEAAKETIKITNPTKSRIEFIIGYGTRIEEPWVKYLHHNGFVCTETVEDAKHQEKLFEEQGLEKYGQ